MGSPRDEGGADRRPPPLPAPPAAAHAATPLAGSAGGAARVPACQAAATDTLELTEENVELVLDEVGASPRGQLPTWGTAYCRGTSPVLFAAVALQALLEELHPVCTRVCHVCLLPEQVRPYLMADGGNVEFVEIDGPVVRCCLQCSVLCKLRAAACLDMPAARSPGGCEGATDARGRQSFCASTCAAASCPVFLCAAAAELRTMCTLHVPPVLAGPPSVPPPALPGPPRPVRSPSFPQVYLRLAGACGSCPSSLTTMTMGIKRRLMERIPVSGHSANLDTC